MQESSTRTEVTVLHVDDDIELTEMLSTWMDVETPDICILSENDTDDALAVLDQRDVDCVVSDYDMPQTDGLAFLEAIRERHPDLPFILFTGKGSEEIASEAISAGVTDYLQKEVGTEQYEVLVNRIRNAVERQRAQTSLEESEEKYSTLVEEANDGVLIVQDGRIDFANQKAADILGTTGDNMEGEFMTAFVAPEDKQFLFDRYKRREAGESVESRYEFTALAPDGERIPMEIVSSKITYEGEPAVMAICRDVSARKKRVQELEKYRTLVETIADPMYVLDRNGTITMVNDAFTDHAGITRDRLVGTHVSEFINDETMRKGLETIQRLQEHGEMTRGRFEFESELRDDERVYEDNLALLTDDDGEFIGTVGTIRDVTERTERERELTMYRTVVDAADDVIYALDHSGTILMANDRLVEELGVPRSELVGDHITRIVDEGIMSEESVQQGTEFVAEIISGNTEHVRFESETTLEDGPRIVENNFTRFPTDTEWGVVNISRDVSKRKERERELERYGTIVETVPDAAIVIDESGTIVESNENGAAMFGMTKAELLGANVQYLVDRGIISDSIVDRHQQAIRRLLSGAHDEEEAVIEFEAFPTSDEARVYEHRIALLPFEDQYRGTAGIIRDMTDRKDREQQLRRQNERLEAFANALSHDLRNPLEVARGRAELLRTELATASAAGIGTEDDPQEHLDRIERAHGRIGDIIEDVLTLARQGEAVTASESVDLATVAEEAWLHVETEEATLQIPSSRSFRADPDRLTRLLENLFRNAVEHVGPDVTVTVDATGDGFYVADNGPGIPPEERDEVLESGYTTGTDGTGLGLAIVREIAEAHGWTLTLSESDSTEEPDGARFEFSSLDAV